MMTPEQRKEIEERVAAEKSGLAKQYLSKRRIAALERLFTAEIDPMHPGIVQSKAKVFSELEGDGLAEWRRTTIGADRFGSIVVEGWGLTLAGNFAYCEWASTQPLEVA